MENYRTSSHSRFDIKYHFVWTTKFRKGLALKVDRSITSEDVIDTLEELFAMYGVPRYIRSDNGPEFVAKSLRGWLERIGVEASMWSLGVRGRTVTRRVSTAGGGTSSWRPRSLRVCQRRGV